MNIPKDELSEQRILSAVITKEDAVYNLGSLSPDHFYNEKNKDLYRTCQSLIKNDKTVDIVSLSAARTKESKFDDSYVLELANVFSTLATLDVSINSVVDKFRKRRLLEISQETLGSIQDEDVESGDLLEKITNDVANITDDLEQDKSHIGDLVGDFKQWVLDNHAKVEASDGGIIGLSTGVTGIDEITDGMQDGHLWVIGAMTSGGKSAMMLNMVNSVLKSGKKASVYSLEMSKNGIINRVLSIRHKWDASLIKRLGVEKKELSAAINQLGTEGLKIYDSSLNDIEQIMMSIVRDVRRNETDAIFIDYIQLVSHNKAREDRQKLEYISKQLRMLAGRVNKPVILLSQKSNEAVDNPNKETAGFMGSGAIAQSATIAFTIKPDVPVMMRKELHKQGLPVPVKIDFDKSQEGAVSYTLASFTGKTGVFETVDQEQFDEIKRAGDEVIGGGDF